MNSETQMYVIPCLCVSCAGMVTGLLFMIHTSGHMDGSIDHILHRVSYRLMTVMIVFFFPADLITLPLSLWRLLNNRQHITHRKHIPIAKLLGLVLLKQHPMAGFFQLIMITVSITETIHRPPVSYAAVVWFPLFFFLLLFLFVCVRFSHNWRDGFI